MPARSAWRSRLILQVDAGNSRVHWRLLDGYRKVCGRGDQPWEAVSGRGLEGVDTGAMTGLEFASVAGERAENLKEMLVHETGVGVRTFSVAGKQCGVTNAYSDVARMGVDRWLAMIGAFRSFSGPLTVLDAGTAITIDHVSADGMHDGGYILPGLTMMKASLGAGTSGVRADPVASGATWPGRSTSECVHHGVAWLFEAMVVRAGAYWAEGGPLVATGGDAHLIAACPGVTVIQEPDLVFLGMDAVVADGCPDH
ncbi:MAG: type III pantothenate kinase [Pseudomonadota bacterium]